jgi:DNA-directed RNA polymerase subunit E'/Rpb7
MQGVYSLVCLSDKVSLKPSEMANGIRNSVRKYLIDNFEGKVTPSELYIIKIIDINNNCIKNGLINEINGATVYEVEYSAFVFNAIVGASFDITVTKCNDLGIWGFPTICENNNSKVCIECISSCDLIKDYVFSNGKYIDADNNSITSIIEVGSKVNFTILNKQVEHSKIVIFGEVN